MTDPKKPFAGWRGLIVDDEFDSRMVATILLEDAGAEVLEAENGQDAWEMLQANRPNFVLSDLSMPEMDGWRLMAEISKNEGLRGLPVIALTAHAMVGDRERVLAAGFLNHITKPLDPDNLISQLLEILVAKTTPQVQPTMQSQNGATSHSAIREEEQT